MISGLDGTTFYALMRDRRPARYLEDRLGQLDQVRRPGLGEVDRHGVSFWFATK